MLFHTGRLKHQEPCERWPSSDPTSFSPQPALADGGEEGRRNFCLDGAGEAPGKSVTCFPDPTSGTPSSQVTVERGLGLDTPTVIRANVSRHLELCYSEHRRSTRRVPQQGPSSLPFPFHWKSPNKRKLKGLRKSRFHQTPAPRKVWLPLATLLIKWVSIYSPNSY